MKTLIYNTNQQRTLSIRKDTFSPNSPSLFSYDSLLTAPSKVAQEFQEVLYLVRIDSGNLKLYTRDLETGEEGEVYDFGSENFKSAFLKVWDQELIIVLVTDAVLKYCRWGGSSMIGTYSTAHATASKIEDFCVFQNQGYVVLNDALYSFSLGNSPNLLSASKNLEGATLTEYKSSLYMAIPQEQKLFEWAGSWVEKHDFSATFSPVGSKSAVGVYQDNLYIALPHLAGSQLVFWNESIIQNVTWKVSSRILGNPCNFDIIISGNDFYICAYSDTEDFPEIIWKAPDLSHPICWIDLTGYSWNHF